MNKSFRFPKVTRSALVMVCAVSLIGCNRNASVKTDGSRDATKVADDNVPNNKRSLTGTWVSKDRQYELIVRDDGSASFGYRGGVMNSLSWKVSSTEGIILDYGDMRAGFKFRGNNDIDEAIYSSSNGTRYYTRQSSDGRAAREDKALDPVGVFNGVSPLGGTVRYRLDSDGTYTCFIQGGVRDEVTNGTWKLSGDSVSLNDRGATYAMRVTSRGLMSGSYLFKRAGIELSGGNVEEPSSQNAQVTQEPSATEANAKVAAQEDKASISEEERNRQIDKAVLRNARMLSAAADHYYLENGVSTVASVNLIGPTMEIKSLGTVANEVYPSGFTLGTTITVSNVAGVRTITYSP